MKFDLRTAQPQMIRRTSIIGILALSISCLLTQRTFAKDFLWRAKSATATVYLLGSVHLLRSTDHPLPASFNDAYDSAQQVAFELDLDDLSSVTVQSYLEGKAHYPAGQTIRSALPQATYQKLQNFAVAHGVSSSFFDSYRPWYASALIENFNAGDARLEGTLGVDTYFFDAAKGAGKTRIFLETATFQVDTLAAVAESEYVSLLSSQIDNGKQELVELVDAWRGGNVVKITQLIEASRVTSPEQYRLVFLNRNENFLVQVANFLRQSKTTLFIVGAGHLVGTDGVVSRLQDLKYDIVQLPGTPPSVAPLRLDYAPVDGENIQFEESATPALAEGASFTISASASGDGAFAFQWFRDGQVLPGATNAALKRDALKSFESGEYHVRVQSEFGTATSRLIRLTVVPVAPPRLSIRHGRFGVSLNLSGTTNAHYRLEFADRLPGPWLTLTNLTLVLREQSAFDGSTNRARFYRLLSGEASIVQAPTTPTVSWARTAGGVNGDEAYGIATDASGNAFVSGSFVGAARFADIEINSQNISDRDIFVGKYDNSGNLLWIRTAGSKSDDYGRAIATDSAGNCYVTGTVDNGNATFGTNLFSASTFVAKYDGAGNFEWVVPRGGRAIVADKVGNTYAAGGNPLVEKSDTSGKLIFSTASPAGSGHLFGLGIAVDEDRNSYVAGQLSGQVALEGTALASKGTSDLNMFIAKFANDGKLVWAKSVGGSKTEIAFNVAVDSQNNSFVTGAFSGNSELGDAPDTDSMFVAKFDPDGTLVWARQAVGRTSTGYGLATDELGNVYASGFFGGPMAIGAFPLDAQGGVATWIARFDKNGEVNWAISSGGGGASTSLSIRSNGEGFLCGSFRGTSVPFGSERLSSTGFYDAFLVKLTGL